MSDDKRGADAEQVAQGVTVATVGAFLRALAQRAESDPAFSAQLQAALEESGLDGQAAPQREVAGRGSRARQGSRAVATTTPATDEPLPDPFSVYRAQGEEKLRALLDTLELTSLRAIVRTHRLDPARISARWSARDRVIKLIVDQVKARANHGRAFERV